MSESETNKETQQEKEHEQSGGLYEVDNRCVGINEFMSITERYDHE
ncbi:hypothetical protein [Vibrio phage ST2-1pr]|nr:hypothetical protein [Vibrio sp. St2]QXM18782.1 hypothetical protein [Vibrio phage ST2-1pr]